MKLYPSHTISVSVSVSFSCINIFKNPLATSADVDNSLNNKFG